MLRDWLTLIVRVKYLACASSLIRSTCTCNTKTNIVTQSHTFAHTSHQIHVFALNFDCVCPLLLAKVFTLVLVWLYSIESCP